MFDLTIAVPIIIALVSVLKTAGLPTHLAPLVSLILGIITFYFIGDDTVAINVFNGIIAGLSASGLYSGAKASLK